MKVVIHPQRLTDLNIFRVETVRNITAGLLKMARGKNREGCLFIGVQNFIQKCLKFKYLKFFNIAI